MVFTLTIIFGSIRFLGSLNFTVVHALGLASCCLYGGSPYSPQEYKLKKGVDIVVGTPGRIKVKTVLVF